jgi:hypothetical protein
MYYPTIRRCSNLRPWQSHYVNHNYEIRRISRYTFLVLYWTLPPVTPHTYRFDVIVYILIEVRMPMKLVGLIEIFKTIIWAFIIIEDDWNNWVSEFGSISVFQMNRTRRRCTRIAVVFIFCSLGDVIIEFQKRSSYDKFAPFTMSKIIALNNVSRNPKKL